jgi:DNA-binding NarL/FixJ family response regulator
MAEVLDESRPFPQRCLGLVEDDVQTAARLAEGLHQAGWRLAWQAGTVAAARSALSRGVPDGLLVDLGLPDGHGTTLIAEALRLRPDCQILVISVFGDERSVLDAIAAGASGYLVKGQSDAELVRHLGQLADGGSPLSPAIARQVLAELRGRLPVPTAAGPGEALTAREHEVLRHIACGYTYDEAAALLGVSLNTVRHHVKQIYGKLAVSSRGAAVYEAQQRGWLDLSRTT